MLTDAENVATVEPLLLRVRQVADVLGLSDSKVRTMIATGELDSLRFGGCRRVPLDVVEAYVARLRTGGGAES